MQERGDRMTLSTEYDLPSPHLQRRIREVQAFLAENLDHDVDLRAIAQEASLSPYYFTRQFTAFVGVPPYRYLIQLRIDRARALLRETELTVTQICHRVGFNSLSHFTTTFRQHTGVSPSAYRRRVDWEQDVRFSPTTDQLVHQPNKRMQT
jgi:AraC-like DNA-binding protein